MCVCVCVCVRAEEGNNTTEKKTSLPESRTRCWPATLFWVVCRSAPVSSSTTPPPVRAPPSVGRSMWSPVAPLSPAVRHPPPPSSTYLKNTLRVSRYSPQSSGHRRDRLPYRTGTNRVHDHDVRRCWCSGVGSILHTRIRLGIPVCTVPVLIYNPNWNISTDASNYRRRWDSQNILPVPTRCEIFVNSSWVGVVVVVRSLPRT